MISLLGCCADMDTIKNKHKEYAISLVKTKLEKYDDKKFHDDDKKFIKKVIESLDAILIGDPQALQEFLNENNNKQIPKLNNRKNNKSVEYKNSVHNFFKEAFNFETYRDNYGKWLVDSLNIQVCPYCNRQYIFTFKKERVKKGNKQEVVPAFDHFYCRSKYPYFGLSLYNLIPSCDICNSRLKVASEFTLGSNLHPYTESFHDHLRFSIKIKEVKNFFDDADVGEIDFVRKGEYFSKAESNAKVFNLKAAYEQGHKDYIAEQVFKARVYNDSWAKGIMDEFAGLFASDEELKRFYFGNYVRREDINKRPLAKLTIDILEEFGIK